ncbi:MAG: protein TolR [Sphingomonadaceae bacterium]
MSGRGRGGRRAPMSEINVTPLVDVMLVLLIIFMVAAPLLVAGVPVNLPDSRAKALDQEQQPVQISIDGNGQLFIDDEAVPQNNLTRRLNAILSDNQGQSPQILLRADRALSYGAVMQVMGELNAAGLNKVALITAGTDQK